MSEIDGLFHAVKFIIMLPIHTYHTITLGRYAKTDNERAIYQTCGILLSIFCILRAFIIVIYNLFK